MKRCEALKGDGSRCHASAMKGSTWCYNHDPSMAEERSRNARRGGKAGGRGRSPLAETEQAKRYTKAIIGRLVRDDHPIDRAVATAVFMGINTLMRVCEQERKIVEQAEVIERLENLESALDDHGDYGRGYGA